MVAAGSRDSGRAAALGCRAPHWMGRTGRGSRRSRAARGRLPRPRGTRRPPWTCQEDVYHAARPLEPAAAADLVEGAERIAAEQAAAALERTLREARDEGAVVRSCAVVVGTSAGEARLETILASHALVHAAEGRLYQGALLQSAEARALDTIAIAQRSIWEEGEAALGIARDELQHWIDQLRREVGPPWAQDQKLAGLAAWIALARSS